jgi:cbb3-type cytochrome c oxidase subunit III
MLNNAMNAFIRYLSVCAVLIGSSVQAENRIEATIEEGAAVFNERCSLCHGNVGMGDGLLPRLVEGYPNTNLRTNKDATDANSIREAIIYGGEKGLLDARMPPYGDELTWLEIESLVLFMRLYYRDVDRAVALLTSTKKPENPSREKGRAIYKGRCILCHGPDGDGKGKMAKIINNPPPFNFQYSALPDEQMLQIITNGGAKVGRSEKMPPFGGELSESDIRSLILYVKGFRKY